MYGIAATHFVNAVREDPLQRGLLYAATERGVYVSADDGAHWQALQTGLPRTSVRDLVVKDNDLVIATHGRGFWILDDVSALRQLAAKPGTATRLFAPAAAVRLRPENFSGTPMPKDEPMASNPPFGAVVDYQLERAPAGPVTLTVTDAHGSVVRRYSSAEQPKPADAATAGAAPEWLPLPVALDATPGLHRFVWPLHHAAPAALAQGNAYADGVWAPPGDYTVELAVDGQRYRQTLRVVPDPRVSLPEAAYAAQFAQARRIEALRATLAQKAAEVSALQKALSMRRAGADAATAKLLEAFQAQLTAVSGSVPASNPGNGWWLPPRTLDSLRFLDGALEALQAAVDGADAAPSPDALAGVTAAEQRLPRVLAACDALRQRDLPELNRRLAARGQAPLQVP